MLRGYCLQIPPRHAILVDEHGAEMVNEWESCRIARRLGMIDSRLECQSKSFARRRLSHSLKGQ
jgi:hypothetical protein